MCLGQLCNQNLDLWEELETLACFPFVLKPFLHTTPLLLVLAGERSTGVEGIGLRLRSRPEL